MIDHYYCNIPNDSPTSLKSVYMFPTQTLYNNCTHMQCCPRHNLCNTPYKPMTNRSRLCSHTAPPTNCPNMILCWIHRHYLLGDNHCYMTLHCMYPCWYVSKTNTPNTTHPPMHTHHWYSYHYMYPCMNVTPSHLQLYRTQSLNGSGFY